MCQTNATETTSAQPWVFEIREEKFGELEQKFAKLVSRARKCKLPAPSFSVLHEADQQVTRRVIDRQLDPTGQLGIFVEETRWVHYLYVVVDGTRPSLAGYDFIATVDHTEADDGIGNIIKAVPGAGEIPVAYRNAYPVCDHCRTARNRHETFIVRRQSDAATFQIGRNCLVDFFPGESPAEIAQQLAWWTEAVELAGFYGGDEDGFEGSGRCGHRRYGIESLLTTTQAVIQTCGWTSRTKAREEASEATADVVLFAINPPRNPTRDEQRLLDRIAEAQVDPADIEAALAWVRSLEPSAQEDYLYNLATICRGETVREDRLGLACSLLPAYRRHLDGERQRVAREAEVPSEYVGEVGTRQLFSGLTVDYISEPYASDYGTTTRVVFKQGSNVIIWWASDVDGFKRGETYDVVATPKKQEEYRNAKRQTTTKQTVVNRVVIADDKDRAKHAKLLAKQAKLLAKQAGQVTA